MKKKILVLLLAIAGMVLFAGWTAHFEVEGIMIEELQTQSIKDSIKIYVDKKFDGDSEIVYSARDNGDNNVILSFTIITTDIDFNTNLYNKTKHIRDYIYRWFDNTKFSAYYRIEFGE